MARGRPHAFTLVETVLSLGILGLIATSMTSIVLLTSRAMPTATDVDVANVAAREVTSRIAGDIGTATRLQAVGARSIQFEVADRDGDGNPEMFEYTWSGTAGDPLVWKYNGSEPITVASNVTAFTIALDNANVTVSSTGPDAWGSEEVLHEYQGSKPASMLVQGLNAYGQYFCPTLPADATGWTVTRVGAWLSRSGTATQAPVLVVQLVDADITGNPGLVKDAAMTLDVSAVTSTSNALAVFTPTTTPTYAPGTGKFLCFSATLATNKFNSANVAADDTAAGPGLLASTTTGLLWTTDSDGGLACVIYGKVRRPSTTTSVVQHAAGVSLTLKQGTGSTMSASARMLNRPGVP